MWLFSREVQEEGRTGWPTVVSCVVSRLQMTVFAEPATSERPTLFLSIVQYCTGTIANGL